MDWETVCTNTNLRDLPYKVELNARGQIIMSPARLYHGRFQNRIGYLLETLASHGESVTECAVKTTDSTKVADVAWFSQDRWNQVKDDFEAQLAPEICIEIVSQSNTKEELQYKKSLYFEAGAIEFWLCDQEGEMSFWESDQEIKKSKIIPKFPRRVKITR